jgi:ferredoxin
MVSIYATANPFSHSRVHKVPRDVRTSFKITLRTPMGQHSFECDKSTYILDAAEENNIELPYSCRTGMCSACTSKLIWGEIDQSEQSFLNEEQVNDGFTLLCVAYPKQDSMIEADVEDMLDVKADMSLLSDES